MTSHKLSYHVGYDTGWIVYPVSDFAEKGGIVSEESLIQELAAIVGEAAVVPIAQWSHSLKQVVTPGTHPVCVVYPETQTALGEVVAYASHQRLGLLPYGSGTKLDWGGLVDGVQVVVSTERMNQIVEHAVGDLTCTVEAGMRLSDLQTTLNQTGQFLALDPAYADRATIGGIVATADTGSLRHRYGGVRDMVIGLSFVRSDGQIAKAGGRVVKNVAGYDLMKLLTGSYGTLGIISQVTFRLYPVPPASQTVLLTGAAQALSEVTATLLASALTPTAVNLLSATTAQHLGHGQGMGLVVRFQSLAESVQEQTNRILELGQVAGLTGVVYRDSEEASLWQRLRAMMEFPQPEAGISCKMGVRLAEAVDLLAEIDQLLPKHDIAQIYASSGVGFLHYPAEALSESLLAKLRSSCQAKGGFLSVLQAPTELKQQIDVWGYQGNALDLMRRIKTQFDPHHLLNPCRFVVNSR